MPEPTLGRTNAVFPPIWLSLATPKQLEPGWVSDLAQAALATGLPLDVSSNPVLWGSELRGKDYVAVVIGNTELERAPDEKGAADQVQAHLLQTMSALGRDCLDFYFLRIRRALEEVQLHGAFEALEDARQEGHMKYLGLCVDGPAFASLGLLQFHDAFEALIVPRNAYDESDYRTIAPLAQDRRVGIVTSRPLAWPGDEPFMTLEADWRLRNLTKSFYGLTLAQAALAVLAKDHPVLVSVSTPKEVEEASAVIGKTLPDGLEALIGEYVTVARGQA